MLRNIYKMTNFSGCKYLRFTKCRMPAAAIQFRNLINITKVRKGSSYEP